MKQETDVFHNRLQPNKEKTPDPWDKLPPPLVLFIYTGKFSLKLPVLSKVATNIHQV